MRIDLQLFGGRGADSVSSSRGGGRASFTKSAEAHGWTTSALSKFNSMTRSEGGGEVNTNWSRSGELNIIVGGKNVVSITPARVPIKDLGIVNGFSVIGRIPEIFEGRFNFRSASSAKAAIQRALNQRAKRRR